MIHLRNMLTLGGATALTLLAIASPADSQVIVNRGINPWTGRPYSNVAVGNPWTGRVAHGGVTTNPWTGTTVRGGQVHNPWTGRTTTVGRAYNPWTGRYGWAANTRRGW